MKLNSRRIASLFILSGIAAAGLLVILVFLLPESSVYALPEYANRTHESCGTCHVSPGGAGPLTLTGLSWIADGRPDKVEGFQNVLIAPGIEDPQMLYEIACVACHGFYGEGLSGSKLIGFNLSEVFLRRVITKGVMAYNMPGFDGKFTQDQLKALSEYVSDLSAGRIEPQESYPLSPISSEVMGCGVHADKTNCGGN
jgi:mono/diheme cytochrome c family protein